MSPGHGSGDNKTLLDDQDSHDGEKDDDDTKVDVPTQMTKVQELQAEVSELQSKLWENDEMTEEEAEEVMRKAELLKIKMVRASERMKQWGMESGLNRLESFQMHMTHWRGSEDGSVAGGVGQDEKEMFYKLLPIAFLFMAFVCGASTVHFDSHKPIPGHLFPLAPNYPIVWPMGHASSMVEARIQIQSSAEPGGGGGGHGGHRRSGPSGPDSFLHNDHKWNKLLRLSAPPMKNLEGMKTKHAPKPPMHAPKAAAPSPNSRKLLQGQRPEKPVLPAGWLAYWSAQYNTYYYYNPSTQVTQWEKPTMPTSSAPAPTPAPARPAAGGQGSHSPAPAPAPAPAAGGGTAHSQVIPTGGGHGHAVDDHVEKPAGIIDVLLFEFGDEKWKHCEQADLACFRRSASDEELLGRYEIQDAEQAILMEFEIKDDSKDQYFVVISENPEPMAIAIAMHSLGWSGRYQVVISGFIMCVLFGLIMTEVMHRTMASMIGAALCLIVLANQNRPPSLSQVVGWMDHGTLGLLWGMMLIVGITMRTGVFEWTGVLACKLSKGDKTQLLLLLCTVTGILSAFLDNVTTILLICPVTCKLCKLVNMDPRPYLISEAIFSNLGGTATMIGDPPNIIIGNMLAKYVDFNAFLFNLGPGVLMASPPVFYFLVHYFKDNVVGELVVDIPKMEKMYPITDRKLLIKCGVVLACVIMSFFLHPLTHLDPAWIAIMGAVWLLVAFDMHHCHEALMGVEWDTLLFFAALFVVVEGVSEMGLLRFIANTLSGMVEGVGESSRQYFSIWLIMWASGIFSAFVDNIPFTATMVPVMVQMVDKVEGISIRPLAWALAFGACFGGNGTLIGASANIVMASKAETEGWPISFVEFFKVGFPVMIISLIVTNVYLFLMNFAFWQSSAGQ